MQTRGVRTLDDSLRIVWVRHDFFGKQPGGFLINLVGGDPHQYGDQFIPKVQPQQLFSHGAIEIGRRDPLAVRVNDDLLVEPS
ncbi:hypothetical protein D3C85_1722700 [compost metagenome]